MNNLESQPMPTLIPIAIPTLGRSWLMRIWIWLTQPRRWMVADDWMYILPDGGQVVIPAGFEFDGASIPRSLWWLLNPYGLLLIPGLIHDYAYKYAYLLVLSPDGFLFHYGENKDRQYWDRVFLDVARDVNGLWILDQLAYWALWLFGGFAWRAHRKAHAMSQRHA